jgi:hypothetical protein
LREFAIVFAENDGSSSTNNVYGTAMVYDSVAAPTLQGFACGAGTWTNTAAIIEKQQIGSEGMSLRLAGAPVDTAALLFVSTASLPIDGGLLGAPGCWLYPDLNAPNYLGSVAATIAGGAASLPLNLPDGLAPMTLTLQWIYIVPNVNPLWLLATEGLTVPIGR